jgi:hypothetical protein
MEYSTLDTSVWFDFTDYEWSQCRSLPPPAQRAKTQIDQVRKLVAHTMDKMFTTIHLIEAMALREGNSRVDEVERIILNTLNMSLAVLHAGFHNWELADLPLLQKDILQSCALSSVSSVMAEGPKDTPTLVAAEKEGPPKSPPTTPNEDIKSK